jgi:hypothetical protein
MTDGLKDITCSKDENKFKSSRSRWDSVSERYKVETIKCLCLHLQNLRILVEHRFKIKSGNCFKVGLDRLRDLSFI